MELLPKLHLRTSSIVLEDPLKRSSRTIKLIKRINYAKLILISAKNY